MEEKNKKLFSTILLAVGVLFIIIAGGIFVSQTWQYLPEGLKKACLVLVTGAFFFGSYVMEKRSLDKASVALYYLGVCFTGFTVKGLMLMTGSQQSLQLCLAMAAMSVPMILRFWRKKGVVELIIQIFLCDGMMLCVADFVLEFGWYHFLCCLTFFVMLLAGMIAYCRAFLYEEKSILRTLWFAYLPHAFLALPFALLQTILAETFYLTVFPLVMLTASVTVLYLSYDRNPIFRIAQSILLLFVGFAFSWAIYHECVQFFSGDVFTYVFFCAFVIGLILMVWLRRKELLLANALLTVFYVLIQCAIFVTGLAGSGRELFCHPYGVAMAMALLAWKYFEDPDLSWLRVTKLTGVFTALSVNVMIGFASKQYTDDYLVGTAMVLLCVLVAFIAEDFENLKDVRAIFYTIALLIGEFMIIASPFLPFRFFEKETGRLLVDFHLEHDVIFLGLGIVLLGIIWYDIFEKIRSLQFVGTCLLLATLIIRNLQEPSVPNVLFLGIGTLVMLIVATLAKKKNYAIASAVALILVVLYLTRAFWLSIEWWVYLFVAGVGLVIFAIKKEKAEK
ncbi:MAG: hypothetical protein J5546_03120 [Lachnospiraceae bacterium]|nr:hypothetical protein [Lachnospiraceae bacterium]